MNIGTWEHQWSYQLHPYLVIAELINGSVTPRKYVDANIRDLYLQILRVEIELDEDSKFAGATAGCQWCTEPVWRFR
jgi:hypothetical protein